MQNEKAPLRRGFFHGRRPQRNGAGAGAKLPYDYSPSVSSEALPPEAGVLMVIVFSVVNRGR